MKRTIVRTAIGAACGLFTMALVEAGETIYFLLGPIPGIAENDSAVIPFSKPEDIDHARDLILRGPSPNGEANRAMAAVSVKAGKDGINRNYLDPRLRAWSWHVDEVLGFWDDAVPEIEVTPTGLERSFDWAEHPPGLTVWAFDSLTV